MVLVRRVMEGFAALRLLGIVDRMIARMRVYARPVGIAVRVSGPPFGGFGWPGRRVSCAAGDVYPCGSFLVPCDRCRAVRVPQGVRVARRLFCMGRVFVAERSDDPIGLPGLPGGRNGWSGWRAIKRKVKGIWWMPWHQEAMKDVALCEKPRGDESNL